MLLCLVAVAGAVTAQALAAVLTLGDRAAAAGRGMLLVEGALETERAHACVERRLPLLPLPPGITLSHERAGGNGRQQVHLVATWASPRGGGGRTVAAQDGVAACP